MGVKGLWSLLNPVARPVQIESMEGKRLAIDSSIWLYQFQATMRDKDGRVLVNAHVLGFLRRINKLLFHGIKPVFVFDGGAPNLKRSTIAERKRKKQGAAVNHAKTAEKLFAAQMRREAVKAAQQARDEQAARDATSAAAAAARYADDAGDQIAEDAVYLEELEGRPGPSVPRPTPQKTPSNQSIATPPPVDPAEERRKKFRKHDPYRLPETEMPTVSTAEKPDARLATEEELKQFIDEVHPEDIDVDSPEFRALPTEVQYEIIGDLRVRSRQQSHRRLADMLRAAPTALDFSRAQIKHLSQRNALTQQLLTVTDMVGKAHLTIPVRIAAERNREYVLVKRGEDQGGGWALGIREGTKANPIKVEEDKEEESGSETESESDSEEDFEIGPDKSEVKAISPPQPAIIDPDLREFRRKEILDAIVRRYAPKVPAKKSLDVIVKSFGKRRQPESAPLFDSVEQDDDVVPTANDEALALALQQEELGSDEEEADPDLARALALSRKDAERKKPPALEADGYLEPEGIFSGPSDTALSDVAGEVQGGLSDTDESMDELEEVSLVPSTRSTPVPISHEPTPVADSEEDEDDFELVEVPPTVGPSRPARPVNEGAVKAQPEAQITSQAPARPPVPSPSYSKDSPMVETGAASGPSLTSRNDDALRIPAPGPSNKTNPRPDQPGKQMPASSLPATGLGQPAINTRPASTVAHSKARPLPVQPPRRQSSFPHAPIKPSPLARSPSNEIIQPSSDPPMEEVPIPDPSTPPKTPPRPKHLDEHLPDFHPETPPSKRNAADDGTMLPSQLRSPHRFSAADLLTFMDANDVEDPLQDLQPRAVPSRSASAITINETEDEGDEDDVNDDADDSRSIEWSKSPSPQLRKRPPLEPAESGETIPIEVDEEDVDMNRDDMDAEEDDYARFMAQIKNRDLNEVRTEIDDEIRVLNNQNKVAMRDSDEITQSMISQIQTLLRHFGIPYITAPMEAEAQCAKLAELGLVDGIITDDSDVFLFGGLQCFKNIFNDAKYAECFLLADIGRELSLSRERLISLAFLLGSDYTIGLPGVGPVVALELLANFPGDDGVPRFKDWWMRVQRGQDSEAETNTRWKKSFKKRYSSSIYLTADWPNPLVREAYKYPTTDESKEPFHWGFPKLSALRAFLHEELSWSISKVDDELTPIVQRIARRGKTGALNKQGTLDPFFDMSVTAGNYAPRRRTTANVSKRLMAVIKQFREAEAGVTGEGSVEWGAMMQDLDESDPKGRGTGQKESRPKAKPKAKGTKRPAGSGDGVEGAPDAEGVEPKKRKTRSRKGTVSSLAASEGSESQTTEATEGDGGVVGAGEDDDGDVEVDEYGLAVEAPPRRGNKKPRGRGRGRGRGRLANVERWNVIQKPD